jgi:hypothetical protein
MTITKQFAEHLISNGHNRNKISIIFEAAAKKIDGHIGLGIQDVY